VQHLEEIGRTAPQGLIDETRNDPSVENRESAVMILGFIKCKEAVDSLIAMIGSQSKRERESAMLTLGEMAIPSHRTYYKAINDQKVNIVDWNRNTLQSFHEPR